MSLPNEEDVAIGVRAAKLAAHIGDVVKLRGLVDLRDREVSKARRDLKWAEQWKHLLFPEEAKRIIEERRSVNFPFF